MKKLGYSGHVPVFGIDVWVRRRKARREKTPPSPLSRNLSTSSSDLVFSFFPRFLENFQRPLFFPSLQEHSYYLDYKNLRMKYVEAVLGDGKDPATGIVDWGKREKKGGNVFSSSSSSSIVSTQKQLTPSFFLRLSFFHRSGPEKPRGRGEGRHGGGDQAPRRRLEDLKLKELLFSFFSSSPPLLFVSLRHAAPVAAAAAASPSASLLFFFLLLP